MTEKKATRCSDCGAATSWFAGIEPRRCGNCGSMNLLSVPILVVTLTGVEVSLLNKRGRLERWNRRKNR